MTTRSANFAAVPKRNSGPEYTGEAKSWIPVDGAERLAGLGEGKWEPAEKTSR